MPNGTAEEWEAGWRKSVNERLDALMELPAIVRNLGQAIQEMREEKKGAPHIAQGWINLLLFIVFGGISALCGLSGLLISLANLLVAHWH